MPSNPPPEEFGPFVLVRVIGSGGMGHVYIARTPWARHPLTALKRLHADVDAVLVQRFEHEARLTVQLEHEHLVKVLQIGTVEGQLYIATELQVGKDAARIIARSKEDGQTTPVPIVVRILTDALAALDYVHGARDPAGRSLCLVHRDVTPGNLLVGYDGVTRLADFGAAKSALTSALTNAGELIGTPQYMAPELIRGERPTAAGDIYGIGAVSYHMLAGRPPHGTGVPQVLFSAATERPASIASHRPDAPRWLIDLVDTMLASDPSGRPQGAGEILSNVLEHATVSKHLITHDAVGRWLTSMYERERAEEEAECERIISMRPRTVPNDKSRVVARRTSQATLRAPEARPRGSVAADQRNRSQRYARLNPLVTDAYDAVATNSSVERPQSKLDPPTVPPGAFAEEEPTRTGSEHDARPPVVEEVTIDEGSMAALAEDPLATVQHTHDEDDDASAALRLMQSDLAEAVHDDDTQIELRGLDIPPSSLPDPTPAPLLTRPDSDSSEETVGLDAEDYDFPGEEEPSTAEALDHVESFAAAPSAGHDTSSQARILTDVTNRRGRPFYLQMIAVVAVGALLGAGLAHFFRGPAKSPTISVPAEISTRFDRARSVIADRRSRGEALPAGAGELVGDIASSVLEGDLDKAERQISSLEELLESDAR